MKKKNADEKTQELVIRKLDEDKFRISVIVDGKENYWIVNEDKLKEVIGSLYDKHGPGEWIVPS